MCPGHCGCICYAPNKAKQTLNTALVNSQRHTVVTAKIFRSVQPTVKENQIVYQCWNYQITAIQEKEV